VLSRTWDVAGCARPEGAVQVVRARRDWCRQRRQADSGGRLSQPGGVGRPGLRESLRQELNPHLDRTKGACLPLTLRRHEVETVGIEPTPCSVQARGTPQSASPRVRSSGSTGRRSTSMDPSGDQDSHAAYGAHLCLDHGVSCRQSGCHAVAAVADDERVTLARESNRRCLATLLQPLAVQLDCRFAEAGNRALADADVVERCPDRLVREHGASSPRSAIRRCGRVESNHHSQRRRGYSALSSPVLSVRTKVARVGLEPTSRAHEAREEAAPPPRDVCSSRPGGSVKVPGRRGQCSSTAPDGTVP
jgi:hypothetical protein